MPHSPAWVSSFPVRISQGVAVMLVPLAVPDASAL